jgi:regulation of enolase protein 1 (concanavalin A-like superfamily)
MFRSASLLLCSLIAAFATAAPAPVYKPRLSAGWKTGWDKPYDPVGDCRFRCDEDRLTVTIPQGKSHNLALATDDLNAPHMLRAVEGDFVLQVRVTGDFSQTSGGNSCGAGILMRVGQKVWVVKREGVTTQGERDDNFWAYYYDSNGAAATCRCTSLPASQIAYIRLERRKDRLLMTASDDGTEWKSMNTFGEVYKLPPTVIVGIVAEASKDAAFQVVFDELVLTPTK